MYGSKKLLLGKGRSNVGIFIILLLVFLFGLSSVIYTDSYKMTLEEQRKLMYGSWHIAVYDSNDEVYQLLKSHGIVKSTGYMEFFGHAINHTSDNETNILGGVGYADEILVDIGDIKLLDGRFPVSGEEIAVEASYLNRMGYSYELGQQITMTISSENNDGEYVDTTYNFILCGVVKNYSSYWKTDGHYPISFFVSPRISNGFEKTKLHIFSEIEARFAENANFLSILSRNNGHFTKNDYTYLQYSGQNDPALNLVIQQTVIILASILFIIILMNTDIRRRYSSFINMRILGATKWQIIQIFLREKLKLILISSILGIICGILLPYLVFLLISNTFTGPVTYYFDAINVIRMVVVLYGGIIISLAFSLFTLFKIPLHGVPRQQLAIKKPHRRRKKLDMNNLFSVFNTSDRGQRLFSIALTFIAAVFVNILAYQTWDIYIDYSEYQSNYPEDYSFGYMTSKHPPSKSMSEESLKEIKEAYGVNKIQTFSISDYYGLSFTSQYDKEYAEAIYEYLLKDVKELPGTEINGTLVGVSDNLLSTYLNEIDSGIVGGKLADDEIIIYLPNYYKQTDGSLLAEVDSGISKPGAQLISEHTIKAGESVFIDTDSGLEKLNIAGIIRSFEKQTPFSYNPMRPYSLICNQNTYSRLVGNIDYAYVLIYNDSGTIPYQTDVELSKIKTEFHLNNNRVERSEQSQNFILQLVLTLILCASTFLVTTIIRFGTYSLNEKQKSERYSILYKLGMSKLTMLKNMVRNAFFNSLIGCCIASFILLVFLFVWEYKDSLAYDDYAKPGTLQFFWDASIRYINNLEWRFIIIIFIFMLLSNFLVQIIHDYKYLYKGDAHGRGF